ncbi:MAG TPA: RNA-binding transcriptional accessory protein [Bacteroidales bacterium]|nr:MAG: RNA-binding transcriptional accessory protein [Bacteroidetes bacterium GWE2_42_24]OFY29495.1 MAG: RNA-binding transcriptional accessory protein [Bacteroidetes bacterium GWF2_43_11]HAQ64694.1 RNA-binding transcriptional accessory protein [Bacteroidales bacterium]HBZ67290.1 RNA-binding transcriptional accessory protein [Bacteroidales bacterium]
MIDFARTIAYELSLDADLTANVIKLLADGATIPFIARYRKEMTGSMDEVAIMAIRDRLHQLEELEKRRETVLNSITGQGKLTGELRQLIEEAATMAVLEDLYLPYKPKRRTRATIAREKGLEPLAKQLMSQHHDVEPELISRKYISDEKGVGDVEAALTGARDIMAEWISEDAYARQRLRSLFQRSGIMRSKVAKGKEAEGEKYRIYFDSEEKAMKAPSHRLLAMFRGEDEGFLKLVIEPSAIEAVELLERFFVRNETPSAVQVRSAAFDSYKRLMQPSLETEIRQLLKEKADAEAIRVFAENLRQLLMAAPLQGRNVLALDPGFRTGCKLVCLDCNGKLLHNETIYPHPPENKVKESSHKIKSLVNAYKISAIAVGNGTAGRETEAFIRHIPFDGDMLAVMVNEAGASVYSASAVARDEFPDYDVTVRGAVSIGRRLIDPLAELVKIDPKSIGVGQYQHDVDQNALQKSLEDVVVNCVNLVGVDLNTASKELLAYVSGIGPSLAKNIFDYRSKKGSFQSRDELLKVPRLGEKAFEQAAGFLRIPTAVNPLDTSAVHPESYSVVDAMAGKLNTTVAELMNSEMLRKQLKLEEFVTEKTGLPTLKDIMSELSKPGRDPRSQFEVFEFDRNVHTMGDLIVGMELPGIITNITNFGAFVDIGVHQDGLVHVSQLADRYVSNPNEVVTLNQKVMVRVLEVDVARKRINLSMKKNG